MTDLNLIYLVMEFSGFMESGHLLSFQVESSLLEPLLIQFNAVHNFTRFLYDKYSTLSSGVCIGLPLNLFPWTLQTHTSYDIFISSMRTAGWPFRIFLDIITLAISREQNKLMNRF
jgi:hypothetical protein